MEYACPSYEQKQCQRFYRSLGQFCTLSCYCGLSTVIHCHVPNSQEELCSLCVLATGASKFWARLVSLTTIISREESWWPHVQNTSKVLGEKVGVLMPCKGCPATRSLMCCESWKAVINFFLSLHELKPLPANTFLWLLRLK